MFATVLMQILISGSMQVPAQPVLLNVNKDSLGCKQSLAIASSGRQAPGPDHGADPHRETHDVDPYNWSTGNGSDPYGGSTTNGSDPYGGRFPGSPFPKDPYGGNVPD